MTPRTVREAAALLGLSPKTLYMQIRVGKMRATRRGGALFITKREIERYRRESKR